MLETPMAAAMVDLLGTSSTVAASIVAAGMNQIGSPYDL
jgi:hypothetical protein